MNKLVSNLLLDRNPPALTIYLPVTAVVVVAVVAVVDPTTKNVLFWLWKIKRTIRIFLQFRNTSFAGTVAAGATRRTTMHGNEIGS